MADADGRGGGLMTSKVKEDVEAGPDGMHSLLPGDRAALCASQDLAELLTKAGLAPHA
jgi:hypothetical protein